MLRDQELKYWCDYLGHRIVWYPKPITVIVWGEAVRTGSLPHSDMGKFLNIDWEKFDAQ